MENTTTNINETIENATAAIEKAKAAGLVDSAAFVTTGIDPEVVEAIYNLGYSKGKTAGAIIEKNREAKAKKQKKERTKKPPMSDRIARKLGFERIKKEKKGDKKEDTTE